MDRALARVIIMIVIVAGHVRNRRLKGGEDMTEAGAEAGISDATPTVIAAMTTIGIMATSITSSPRSMRWLATTRRVGSMLQQQDKHRPRQQRRRLKNHRGEETAGARAQAGAKAHAVEAPERRRKRPRVGKNGREEAIGGQATIIIPADPGPGPDQEAEANDGGPPAMTRNGAAARKRRRRRSDLPTMTPTGTIRSDISMADREPWWPIGTASSKTSEWGPLGGWWSASIRLPVPPIGSPSRWSATSSATPTAPSSRPTSSRTSTAAVE